MRDSHNIGGKSEEGEQVTYSEVLDQILAAILPLGGLFKKVGVEIESGGSMLTRAVYGEVVIVGLEDVVDGVDEGLFDLVVGWGHCIYGRHSMGEKENKTRTRCDGSGADATPVRAT